MARVAEARLLYAKCERKNMWNGETNDRFGSMLARILGGRIRGFHEFLVGDSVLLHKAHRQVTALAPELLKKGD